MVVTYLLILTGVVGYACWRGYQAEVWLNELSKSVGQLANSVTNVELEQVRAKEYADTTRDLAYGTSDRIIAMGPILEKLRLSAYSVTLDPYETVAKIGSLDGRLDKLEKAAKKPRGKK